MIIMTKDGIIIHCLPENALCDACGKSPLEIDRCPEYMFDDDGDYCMPEICQKHTVILCGASFIAKTSPPLSYRQKRRRQMADVVIRGMEMPSSCDMCWALDDCGDYPRCRITEEQRGYNFRIREKRMDKCPLVPAVDAVEVVRCRECRRRDPEDHKCECGEMERQGCPFPVDDDYFCAYGKRKGGGKNEEPV